MLAFVLRRLLWACMLLVLVSFFTFVLFFVVPGHVRVVNQQAGALSLTRQYNIQGESFFHQYGDFLWRFVRHGDLGRSFDSNRPVMAELTEALPITASVIAGGALLWLMMAFPIGILSALRPRSLLDRLAMVFVLVGVSAHPVWTSLIFSYVFGFKLHLTPIAGYCSYFHPRSGCTGAGDWFYHLLLPWITFALLFTALYTRMIRAMVLEILDEDYVRTARAKGAAGFRIIRSHVLPNALLPIVTMLGMDIGLAFGGTLFIESIFDVPGTGFLLYHAAAHVDLPVIMGVFLVISLAVVLTNLVADIVGGLLDPRVNVTRAAQRGRPLRASRASGPMPGGSTSAAAPQ